MNKFVCNTGAAFNLYQLRWPEPIYMHVACVQKKRRRVAFLNFFWGEEVFIHRLYQYVLTVFLNCFFQQERFKWFLVPLIKNGRNLWQSASIFLGILNQSFVTNINWNQWKVLLGIVINLLWKCFEGMQFQYIWGVQVETCSQSQRYIDLYEIILTTDWLNKLKNLTDLKPRPNFSNVLCKLIETYELNWARRRTLYELTKFGSSRQKFEFGPAGFRRTTHYKI